jgi:hypothetical protein
MAARLIPTLGIPLDIYTQCKQQPTNEIPKTFSQQTIKLIACSSLILRLESLGSNLSSWPQLS